MANDSPSPKIDLNQADAEMLMTLPGIGPALAERIIHFRKEVQPFEEAIEITAVKGVSEQMYRRFADSVTVSPPLAPGNSVSEAAGQAPLPEPPEEGAELDDKVETSAPPPDESTGGRAEETEGYLIISGDAPKEVVKHQPQQEFVVEADESKENGAAFWRPWLLMLVGALLGALISLGLLYVVNDGALVVANNPTIIEMNRQLGILRQREAALNNEVDQLKEQLNAYAGLDTRLRHAEAEVTVLQQEQDSLGEQLTIVNERAEALEGQVATLSQETADMQVSINELQADTGRFDDFLTRLRDLLLAVQGAPEDGSTGITTATATPAP